MKYQVKNQVFRNNQIPGKKPGIIPGEKPGFPLLPGKKPGKIPGKIPGFLPGFSARRSKC